MTLLPKPKREAFILQHTDFPLFKDGEFAKAECDYYKARAEFAEAALNAVLTVPEPLHPAQRLLIDQALAELKANAEHK